MTSGVKKADAFRQVAEEYGQPFASMRGAYYAHTRSLGSGSSKRSGKRSAVPVDPIESATIILEKAIEAIDGEISTAKGALTTRRPSTSTCAKRPASARPRLRPRSTL